MAKCPGCSAEIGCSCNIKKASDGSQRCGACLYAYEQSLQPKNIPPPPANTEQGTNQPQSYQVQAPVINSITHYNNYNN